MSAPVANIARLLPEQAERTPDRPAVLVPRPGGGLDPPVSYAELEERSNRVAAALAARGARPGDRVCVFVRPSADLVAVVYAVFKLGAVVVLADPGMGRKRLLAAIERTRPRIFVGMPLAHAARRLFPGPFRTVDLPVTVGRRLFWRGPTLAELVRAGSPSFPCHDGGPDAPAAILFTSGSTGPPKGVVYTHGMFEAQMRALGTLYAFRPGEVDLACFPLFALFDVALGMTSAFAPLDPSRPGRCDPAAIVDALERTGATTTFGSPAIWRRVVPWCLARGRTLPTLERVLVAGAPVPPALLADFHRILPPGADVHTPYGATEALPVTSIAGREVVPSLVERVHGGHGTCVGVPAPEVDLRLIAISDDPIEAWNDSLEVPPGELGEVCVRGPAVTRLYDAEPGHTALAKIRHPDGSVGHRMGDVGYLDDEGRLWFCGRKAHRLETERGRFLPVPTENVYNVHPRVHRTALVGVGPAGAQRPTLVVEPRRGDLPRGPGAERRFEAELRRLTRPGPLTVEPERVLFHPSFPVDVRHNAKIHRGELRTWAARQGATQPASR